METPKPTKTDLKKRLAACGKKYERTKARIQKLGFISQGSLTERPLRCGNPKCRCHKDPDKRHGPYFQLSWKEGGKTVSHFLPADMAPLYREWLQNRGALMAIVDEMQKISREASDCVRAMQEPATKTQRKAAKKGQRGKKKSVRK